jgi:transcriptional regulator with XRE-family HTH domain
LPDRRQFDPARLVGFLAERDWTQQELAHRMGVANQQINGWVRGRYRPDVESLAALAAALDKPMEAFLTVPTAREEVPA